MPPAVDSSRCRSPRPCSRERSRDEACHHDQRPCAPFNRGTRRSLHERFSARSSRHDRHQVRLRAAQCLSCAVIIDNPDGTSYTSPTCIVSAASFDGKAIRTVEGHARNGELTALQKAFIDHFALQCGYCTAGFLNEAQVLLERLARKPVARAELEQTITDALDGHICRCTGYIKYHEAVREVILAEPQRYLA